MYWAEGSEDPESITWTTASGAIFDNQTWEPGRVEAKYLKIENKGTLAFKYKLMIVPNGEVESIADVIDVYYVTGATKLTRDMLVTATPVGTLRDMINETDGAAHGAILPVGATANGDYEKVGEVVATIAFKMRESANNDYQNKKIGTNFDLQLLATQYAYEKDSFDEKYDNKAVYEEEVQVEAQPWRQLDAVQEDTVVDGGGYTFAADYQEVALAASTDITIKGVTFQNGLTLYTNRTDIEGTVTLENCTIYLNDGNGNAYNESLNMHYADYGLYIGAISKGVTWNFINCTFTAYDNHTYTNAENNSYNVYIGGNYSADSINFENCKFEGSGKHGIGCSFGYNPNPNDENKFTYYNLTVTGCTFINWNNNNQNGAAIRGNVPADVLSTFNKTISISGNTYGESNGSNKANVTIDDWNGSWS